MSRKIILFTALGDVVVLMLLTVTGFAFHGEQRAVLRMLSTLVPLMVAWAPSALPLGVYDEQHLRRWQSLWRPFWAAVLAVPLAAWLRALWLSTVVIPTFVAVLGAFTVLFLTLWRTAWWFFFLRQRA